MSSTPESRTISMVVKEWQGHHQEQYSPVQRINGYPWRLLLQPGTGGNRTLYLVCDKSSESALWQCDASNVIVQPTLYNSTVRHIFKSWDKNSQQCQLCDLNPSHIPAGTTLEVELQTEDDGESWRRYSSPDHNIEPRDGILVIGEDKKKVYVNQQSLSLQSPFFDRLFNGYFKEMNLEEITIGDVEYEEFCNIIKLIHGFGGSQLDDGNVLRVMELADRFELKIVEDRVVSYLLSSSFTTLVQSLLLSEYYNLTFLKDQLLSRNYTKAVHKSIMAAAELEQLSSKTLSILYKKAGEHLS